MIKRWNIATRLGVLIGMTLCALAIVTILGIVGMRMVTVGINEIYEGGIDSLKILHKLEESYREIFETLEDLNRGGISWSEGKEKIKEIKDTIEPTWNNYKKTKISSQQVSLVETEEGEIKQGNHILSSLNEILLKQDREELNGYVNSTVRPKLRTILKNMDKLVVSHIEHSTGDYEHALAYAKTNAIIIVVISFFIIIFAITFAVYIVRSIVLPLHKIVDTLDEVALGKTKISLQNEDQSKDEIALLQHSVKKMIESSNNMTDTLVTVSKGDLSTSIPIRSTEDTLGQAINNMIAKLQVTLGELQQEVQVLSSSAQEIGASVTQVSSGASETAAAVTETTTTMEELKQTAQVSAEKSKEVLGSAETTLKAVTSSEEFVKATIEDMSQIQEKMKIISESIIKLSEHSLAIGEIINTVNDLAEQSNLLAVNAAIEAAKAGEQGKSFSVVAQEIRALAEQSKGATVQVKAILNDIQNATSAAVMATEQGSRAVAKGVDQSSQTKNSMKSVLESMNIVTQSAKQISISSQQQFVGIDQVKVAMANINESTGQYVNQIKQIEIAVASLNNVGAVIRSLLEQYQCINQGKNFKK